MPICRQVLTGQLSEEENSALKLAVLENNAKNKRLAMGMAKSQPDSKSEILSQPLFKNLSSNFVSEEQFDFLTLPDHENHQINCQNFKHQRQYILQPLSYEEESFPIAYSITIHKDLQMFERLLRSIYHPQNFYCIHVDQKSPKEFRKAVEKLISCFDNVFHPAKQVKLYYLHYSRVQADLNCLETLAQYKYKYVFNLCGQDFPIKTNLKLVQDLKNLNGKNENESVDVEKVSKLNRIMQGYDLNPEALNSTKANHAMLVRNPDKDKQPGNLNYAPMLGQDTGLFAGSAYFLFSKAAIDFILQDAAVQGFLDWMKNAWSPDESIWATLSRYHRLPGSYGDYPSHIKYEFNEVHARTRLVKWAGLDRANSQFWAGYNSAKFVPMYQPCGGKYLRGVCVYGTSDLPWLINSRHWFANKFDAMIDPLAIDCLDIFIRHQALKDSFDVIYH